MGQIIKLELYWLYFSDSIHAIKWEQDDINSINISTMRKDLEWTNNKFNTSFQVMSGEIAQMADWIYTQFVKHYDTHNKAVKMEMIDVKSSQISAIGHDGNTLRVRFKNGSEYDYSGMSPEAFNEFLGAESIGSHFGKNVRGVYEYSKVEKEEK